ncbi:carbohydrate ABC transporter permease [Fodinicola acaciae]|uniref:carbohydrate ABC transporter permease n=1 Tax=Fodinicola acaciae TaxID=2681555 RepID=UPI0013D72F92|nr:sugar ABC transporter permease [Fodinicola acaciae]
MVTVERSTAAPRKKAAPAVRRRRPVGWLATYRDAALFLLPKALLFAVFILVPFVYTFVLVFQNGSLLGEFEWVGLDNFTTIFSDTLFLTTLKNTLLFLVILVPLTMTVPLAVGVLLSSKLAGLRFYRSLIYLPSLLSIVATGLIWRVMADPQSGPLNLFFRDMLGIEVPWLSNGTFAIFFIAVITMWSSLGFNSIIFMAGLNDIPNELIEAARIDGASAWRTFWSIKLPLIRPVMQFVMILTTIASVQVFDVIFVMTQGGPGTATYTAMWYIYQNVFNGGSVGYAATMSVILLVITLVISAIYLRTTRSERSGG